MTAGVDEVALAPLHERVRSALVDRIGISRRKATMTVLLSGVFTVSFTVTLLVVVLDTVAADLKSTVSVVSWSITAPMLAFAVIGPAFGKLGDLIGHKRVFVGGLLGAGIFGTECADVDLVAHPFGGVRLGNGAVGDGVHKSHV